jgi:LPXTG-motif cell wall-anchored protein
MSCELWAKAHGSRLKAHSIKKKKMKKIILAIALFAAVSASAQSDGFFSYKNYDEENRTINEWGTLPTLPSTHGLDFDQSASNNTPLGSGLLLLGGMAVFYARRKKSN